MAEEKPKKTTSKRSENARAVAKEVSETLGSGKLVHIGAIMRRNGYSKSTSKTPKNVTESKTFKEEMTPIVARMIAQRDAAIARMEKTVSKAKYRDVAHGVDILTKNIQLLTGGATSRPNISDLLDSIEKGK